MKKNQDDNQSGSFGGNPSGERVDFDAERDKKTPGNKKQGSDSVEQDGK